MDTLTPGTRLGPYEITAPLGEGGMGTVYRARDTELHREVAIKTIRADVATDSDRLARFSREAQLLASLNHPNIAAIHGLVDVHSGKALVLELVEGPTLADRMQTGPLPFDEALEIARQIADALAAAHEQGVVHRDLKPANVKVRPDGRVKVLDFGLAKALDSAAPASSTASTVLSPTLSMRATTAGLILGTAAYMSPEQASGKPVDKRADIWAFGVVLWEMLTGRCMFEGETISHVLASVLTSTPDVAAAPPRVRRLLARCLEKDPQKRLRDIGDAMTLVDSGPDAPLHDRPVPRRGSVIAWASAGVLATALALVLWLRPAPEPVITDAPSVRFTVDRTEADPYGRTALAFALSPDGALLAYYDASTDGRSSLWIRTLATGERREVPNSAVLGPQPPFFSDDSRQLVHITLRGTSVFDVVTATSRELCRCRFRGGSWNRDGVLLVGSLPQDGRPVLRVSLNDLALTSVTPGTQSGEHDSLPVFLPDRRRFLFTRIRAGALPRTLVGSIDGDAPREVAPGSLHLLATRPDGRGAYALGIDTAGLVAQAIDLDSLTPTSAPSVVVPGAAAASISTNGVLATSAIGQLPQVVASWYDRSGRPLGTAGAPGFIGGLQIAPDGRRVALPRRASRGDVLAYEFVGADGATRRSTVRGDALTWSRDGARVVTTITQDGLISMFESRVDGSGSEVPVAPGIRNAFANDWSPDDQWVLFTARGAESDGDLDLDLWKVRMTGAGERTPEPYITSPAREAQAEFSPDGRFVAYTSLSTGNPEIYVQPFPDASGGKWLVSSGGGTEPHWSRDGKELFYIAGQTIMTVPVKLTPTFSSGTPVKLFDAPVQPWYVNDTDRTQVAPDGRFLLLIPAAKTVAPPIDVIVNWRRLLER